ncbi:MAG: hypothetical protein LBU82_06555 [Treponema sp.]|jgi:hypothetical protein|nr:hypothetical protein [Treponema sp.]
MRKLALVLCVFVFCSAAWAQQAAIPKNLFFDGDGGKGLSIAILPPKAAGLAKEQEYIPSLVQGEFVSNFTSYSAINVLDRMNLDNQYAELLSGYYDDDAKAGMDLGHLTPTNYIMGGTIIKTASGYAMQINITKSADKMTAASYSGTFTFTELDNLSGVRRASLDLLQKIGVRLNERAKTELAAAAAINHINAQTSLAQGITAQNEGTQVAAFSYYFQAAAFDPSLLEAASRANITNASISSGNIGADIRNDIVWRREWAARLTETETFFNAMIKSGNPPYTLFYNTGIKQGATNYQTETADLNVSINLRASNAWFDSVEKALNSVYSGLNATKRKDDWGFAKWPQQGVTQANPFASEQRHDFSIVFELLDKDNRVLGGRQTISLSPAFKFSISKDAITCDYKRNTFNNVIFKSVKADDISDSLAIRIVSVNGTAPENARFLITALPDAKWQDYTTRLRIEKGVVKGFLNQSDGKLSQSISIPFEFWGDPVTSTAWRK